MQTVVLEIEDSFLFTLKSFIGQFSKNQVSIKEDKLSKELKRRIEAIDSGLEPLLPYDEVMQKAISKWEANCK